ncbi:NlpC/P60 family protein [Patulibacter brassicae]|uniref:NlpC/P60 family protein n=1 Tax=Patulibacter brassicae TaxID=1705717 RepID=A0ABU4VEC6_9ACTN|nr:NlpC/P60 family protein [Patulibacter brassicae]MDX8150112.1 NlpC/P60 family protein [Patulibacter brassicae]
MHVLTRAGVLAGLLSLAIAAPAAAQSASGGVGTGTTTTPPAGATDGTGSTDDGTSAAGTTGAVSQTAPVKLTRSQTKSVQRRVKVRADGQLGSRTRSALKRYQRKKRLNRTGRPNLETLKAMRLGFAKKIERKLTVHSATTTDGSATPAPAGDLSAAIAAAREAIGTPYVSGGNTTSGFDCSGLTVWAFKRAGISLPRTSFDQYKQGVAVDRASIQPGDLVFFDSAGSGASHVGIATSATTAISATTKGVMEHSFASGYWDDHYVGARRVTG